MRAFSRRAFFRGAVAGGAALTAVAAVGLPALPKRKLIPFKFDESKIYTIEWGKSYFKTIRVGLPVATWRKLHQSILPSKRTRT